MTLAQIVGSIISSISNSFSTVTHTVSSGGDTNVSLKKEEERGRRHYSEGGFWNVKTVRELSVLGS